MASNPNLGKVWNTNALGWDGLEGVVHRTDWYGGSFYRRTSGSNSNSNFSNHAVDIPAAGTVVYHRGRSFNQTIIDEVQSLKQFDHLYSNWYTNKERITMSQQIEGDYDLFEVIIVRQPDVDEDGDPVGKPSLLVREGAPIRELLFARDGQQAVMEAARKLPEEVALDDVAIIARKLS